MRARPLPDDYPYAHTPADADQPLEPKRNEVTNRVERSPEPESDPPQPLPGVVDARFTLAAERTALAWLRTALGLIAAGIAVLHLLGSFGEPAARTALGISLLLIGALTAVIGLTRWRAVDRALHRGGPLPGPWPVLALGALIVLASFGFVIWR